MTGHDRARHVHASRGAKWHGSKDSRIHRFMDSWIRGFVRATALPCSMQVDSKERLHLRPPKLDLSTPSPPSNVAIPSIVCPSSCPSSCPVLGSASAVSPQAWQSCPGSPRRPSPKFHLPFEPSDSSHITCMHALTPSDALSSVHAASSQYLVATPPSSNILSPCSMLNSMLHAPSSPMLPLSPCSMLHAPCKHKILSEPRSLPQLWANWDDHDFDSVPIRASVSHRQLPSTGPGCIASTPHDLGTGGPSYRRILLVDPVPRWPRPSSQLSALPRGSCRKWMKAEASQAVYAYSQSGIRLKGPCPSIRFWWQSIQAHDVHLNGKVSLCQSWPQPNPSYTHLFPTHKALVQE
jgi:hypothetical protein